MDESDFYLDDSEVPRAQKVREIGIQIFLGATTEHIVGLFLRQGMRLVSIGLALGGIGGIGAAAFAQQPLQRTGFATSRFSDDNWDTLTSYIY